MIELMRDDAVATARVLYHQLIERALVVAPNEADFVRELAASWDEALLELGESVFPGPVEANEWLAYGRLTSAILDPRLPADATVEWVDAFPNAIVRVFSLSAGAGEVDDEVALSSARAGNRQPALALAA